MARCLGIAGARDFLFSWTLVYTAFFGTTIFFGLLTSSACSSILLGEQVTNNAQAYISIPSSSQMGLEELDSVSKFPLISQLGSRPTLGPMNSSHRGGSQCITMAVPIVAMCMDLGAREGGRWAVPIKETAEGSRKKGRL